MFDDTKPSGGVMTLIIHEAIEVWRWYIDNIYQTVMRSTMSKLRWTLKEAKWHLSSMEMMHDADEL